MYTTTWKHNTHFIHTYNIEQHEHLTTQLNLANTSSMISHPVTLGKIKHANRRIALTPPTLSLYSLLVAEVFPSDESSSSSRHVWRKAPIAPK